MGRLLQFHRELMILWRGFLAPGTPVWLKAMMLLVPLYLISPIDFIPDALPILGWLDDLVVIPLLVSWIASRIPQPSTAQASHPRRSAGTGPVIDGDYRRL